MRPDWLPFLWAAFMPVWLVLLWRLRCWNCRQRLMKDGAAHIEWRGPRWFRWNIARHKTCGAELSLRQEWVESRQSFTNWRPASLSLLHGSERQEG